MAWVSTLPDDPIVAASWRRVAERREAEAAAREAAEARRADKERGWWRAAVAARAGRYLRAVDEVLAASCDCRDYGYTNGCVRCRPGVDRRHTRPEPDHGPAARFAGEIEW